MLIYFYGFDSYRRQKKTRQIIEEYQKKHSNFSCDFFDFDPSAISGQAPSAGQEEFLRLKEFSAQQLLFDNKKMAVLNNVFSARGGSAFGGETNEKELKEFFERYLKSEDFTILISENKLPPVKLKFIIEGAFKVEEFSTLDAEKWRFFIQKEADRKLNPDALVGTPTLRRSLTPKAISFLSEIYYGDGWGLINELEKLSLISKNSPIDTEDLKKVCDYGYESPDIFGYINAVSRNWSFGSAQDKSLSQRIIALEKLFIAQEEPVKIFNIFASLNQLPIQLIKKLADYDVMVKSGKMDYDEVLVDLALS
ncbi:MAG: hypothetical protein AAB696_01655 [Patescibacteria group bacterium]